MSVCVVDVKSFINYSAQDVKLEENIIIREGQFGLQPAAPRTVIRQAGPTQSDKQSSTLTPMNSREALSYDAQLITLAHLDAFCVQ